MSSEQRFWEWFVSNRAIFDAFEPGDESVLLQLSDALAQYAEGVVFELSQPVNGVRDLVLSADGILDLLPVVRSLSDAAPVIPGWQVVCLRPRVDISEFSLQLGDLTFDPSNVWFAPIVEEGEFDLVLFLPGFEESQRNAFVNAGYILLDMALGEYDVATGIRYIDHRAAPGDPESAGLLPLRDLPRVFDHHVGHAA